MNRVSSRALRAWVTIACLAVAWLASLAVASNASADKYPASIGCTVSAVNTTAQVGRSVGVTGSGFPAGSSVTLTQNPGGSLGSVKAGSDGSFVTTVSLTGRTQNIRIIASSNGVSCGSTTLGADSQNERRANNNSSNNESATGGTASTGFQTLAATGIAAALLIGGGLLLVIGRRRSLRS